MSRNCDRCRYPDQNLSKEIVNKLRLISFIDDKGRTYVGHRSHENYHSVFCNDILDGCNCCDCISNRETIKTADELNLRTCIDEEGLMLLYYDVPRNSHIVHEMSRKTLQLLENNNDKESLMLELGEEGLTDIMKEINSKESHSQMFRKDNALTKIKCLKSFKESFDQFYEQIKANIYSKDLSCSRVMKSASASLIRMIQLRFNLLKINETETTKRICLIIEKSFCIYVDSIAKHICEEYDNIRDDDEEEDYDY